MNIKKLWENKFSSKKEIIIENNIDIKALKNVTVLKGLHGNEKYLELFTSYCSIKKIPRGKQIYAEGGLSNEMYIILDGVVRIYKKTSDGEHFLLVELRAENGDFFGEVGLIQEQKRSATVRTETDTEVLILSRSSFEVMIEQQPSIATGLMLSISRVLIDRLQKTNADLAYLCDALTHEVSSEAQV